MPNQLKAINFYTILSFFCILSACASQNNQSIIIFTETSLPPGGIEYNFNQKVATYGDVGESIRECKEENLAVCWDGHIPLIAPNNLTCNYKQVATIGGSYKCLNNWIDKSHVRHFVFMLIRRDNIYYYFYEKKEGENDAIIRAITASSFTTGREIVKLSGFCLKESCLTFKVFDG